MTQNRSKTHLSAAAWDVVRRDYEGGLTAELAAERHGVHKRTVHHRAAEEGWRKCDALRPPAQADPLRPPAQGDPDAPGQASLSRQTFDMVARNDRILEVMADSEGERLDLIVRPDVHNFRQFAFRRAAESAALGGVSEANAWLRLIVQIDRASPQIGRDLTPFGHADILRADHAKGMNDLTSLFSKLVPDAVKTEATVDAKDGADKPKMDAPTPDV